MPSATRNFVCRCGKNTATITFEVPYEGRVPTNLEIAALDKVINDCGECKPVNRSEPFVSTREAVALAKGLDPNAEAPQKRRGRRKRGDVSVDQVMGKAGRKKRSDAGVARGPRNGTVQRVVTPPGEKKQRGRPAGSKDTKPRTHSAAWYLKQAEKEMRERGL